jgi:phosphatidylglycerophosphate synthase
MVLGGLAALERRLRELHKRGLARAIVASEPVDFGRPLPLAVEWVAPGTPPPPDALVERADVIAGIEVVDEASRRRAEWALCRALSKSHQGPVDATVNWRFSMRITRLLSRTAITPNQITLFAAVVALAAWALALGGEWLPLAVGGVLMQVHSILDSCDGELARLRYQFSRLGQWLDNLSDDLLDNGFLACAGLGLGEPWAALALAGAAGRALTATMMYIEVYRATGGGDVYKFRWWFERDKVSIDAVYDPRSALTWVRSLGRRDTYVFLWMLLALAGLGEGIAVLGAAIGAVNFAMTIAHLLRRGGR